MSLPGSILGSLFGTALFAVITSTRLIFNNGVSFINLSGSLLNICFEQNIGGDSTIGNDNRPSLIKNSGFIGYIAAGLITAPISLTIYTIRKTPTALAAGISFLATPLTAIVKIYQSFKGTSSTIPNNSDKVMSKFKKMENSLTTWGRLPEGETIDCHHQGSSTATIVKSITLNIDTPTERILHALISAYKVSGLPHSKNIDSNHPNFFNSDGFKKIVEEVKEHYKDDYFASAQDIDISTSNIEKVAELVKNYMQAESDEIKVDAHFYNRPFNPSFYALFQGSGAISKERQTFETESASDPRF